MNYWYLKKLARLDTLPFGYVPLIEHLSNEKLCQINAIWRLTKILRTKPASISFYKYGEGNQCFPRCNPRQECPRIYVDIDPDDRPENSKKSFFISYRLDDVIKALLDAKVGFRTYMTKFDSKEKYLRLWIEHLRWRLDTEGIKYDKEKFKLPRTNMSTSDDDLNLNMMKAIRYYFKRIKDYNESIRH